MKCLRRILLPLAALSSLSLSVVDAQNCNIRRELCTQTEGCALAAIALSPILDDGTTYSTTCRRADSSEFCGTATTEGACAENDGATDENGGCEWNGGGRCSRVVAGPATMPGGPAGDGDDPESALPDSACDFKVGSSRYCRCFGRNAQGEDDSALEQTCDDETEGLCIWKRGRCRRNRRARPARQFDPGTRRYCAQAETQADCDDLPDPGCAWHRGRCKTEDRVPTYEVGSSSYCRNEVGTDQLTCEAEGTGCEWVHLRGEAYRCKRARSVSVEEPEEEPEPPAAVPDDGDEGEAEPADEVDTLNTTNFG